MPGIKFYFFIKLFGSLFLLFSNFKFFSKDPNYVPLMEFKVPKVCDFQI